MSGTRPPRSGSSLVIGLDGVPYGLLSEFMRSGVMPVMASLAEEGSFMPIRAPLPAVSGVSWSSFMTGSGPEKHGIYGFVELDRDYGLRFPSLPDLRVPTLFERLGAAEKTSVVINLPSTYPARPLSGAMVSGFVAVDLAKSVYPQGYLSRLQALGYRVDIDLPRARRDKGYLFSSLFETLDMRGKAADMFWDDLDWDLFVLVVTGTDRLQHFAWRCAEDEGHPDRETFLEYYRAVDRLVGRLVDRYRSERRSEPRQLVLLSDHGFCALQQEVHLNRVLAEHGYLSFAVPSPRFISDLDPVRTRAFSLDPGRIYFNTSGRFSRGSVTEAEIPALAAELAGIFSSLSCQGLPVIDEIRFGGELYGSDPAGMAPDMVLVPHRGFELKGGVQSGGVFAPPGVEGMHTHDDAFCLFHAPGCEPCLAPADVPGVARLVARHLGLGASEYIEEHAHDR